MVFSVFQQHHQYNGVLCFVFTFHTKKKGGEHQDLPLHDLACVFGSFNISLIIREQPGISCIKNGKLIV